MGPLDGGAVREASQLIDYAASEKGSIVPAISKALNLPLTQAQTQPNPNRQYDYEVILGRDYRSCTYGVLPVHR